MLMMIVMFLVMLMMGEVLNMLILYCECFRDHSYYRQGGSRMKSESLEGRKLTDVGDNHRYIHTQY